MDPDRKTEAEIVVRPQEDLLADFERIRLESESCALRCRSLVKRYGKVTAVDGLDLEIRVGECFGLLGPNGAGKTTALEVLEGILAPDSGVVEVFGRAWTRGDDFTLRERLGIQLQEARFAEKLTVEETIRLFRSFYRQGHEVDDILRTVALVEKRQARVGKLSSGQKQRLALACSLVGDPDLLFLDEPTTGLDPQARFKMWALIEQLRARRVTVLLTTHYMEEAARLCDRVAILDKGRVIALGTPKELVESLGAEQVIEFRAEGNVEEEGLRLLPGVRALKSKGSEFLVTVSQTAETVPSLMAELERQKARLVSLATHRATLEDVFVTLTGRRLRDG
jgi:ABC-2 type transport system ATP-binding protein